MVAVLPLGELERSGTDRIGAEVLTVLLERGWARYATGRMRESRMTAGVIRSRRSVMSEDCERGIATLWTTTLELSVSC